MGDEIDEMVVAVRADTGAFRRDIAALRAELEGSLGSGAEAGGRAIERALSRAIVSGKMGFEDLKRLALSVMADIARAAISNGIGAATGGGSGGSGSGDLLSLGTSIAMALFGAPGRATGGPVSAGRAYRVGERGPELFVPTASGRIEAGGAGGVRNIAITVNVRGEAPVAGWAEMSEIAASGSGSVLALGDVVMPELDPAKGGVGIASGYDDSYHLTPARLVRQIVQLGYRGDVVHYVGMARAFVWALPQVARDGFVTFDGEDDVQAFDAVDFPIAIGREAMVATEFSTQIVSSPSGHEQRATEWAEARMRYDAGPGIRSEADVRTLTGFFRARRGAARAFRFRDPFDGSSAVDGGLPAADDQMLGIGDGARRRFALVKRYGVGDAEQVRSVRLPVEGSVRVSVDGLETAAFLVTGEGEVLLDVAPAAGIAVRAGFLFDVPVRFADDRLEVSRATFLAGEMASVSLVEVRAPW